MRLTQKELDVIDKFISKRPRVSGLLKGELSDTFFEPLPDEEIMLWNCEEVSSEILEAFSKSVTNMSSSESIYTDKELDELDNWTTPPSTKPLLYVLDGEKEDD